MALYEQYRTKPLDFHFRERMKFTFDEYDETRHGRPLILTLADIRQTHHQHRYVMKTAEDGFWFVWATAKGIFWVPQATEKEMEYHFRVTAVSKDGNEDLDEDYSRSPRSARDLGDENTFFPRFPKSKILKKSLSPAMASFADQVQQQKAKYTIFDFIELIELLCTSATLGFGLSISISPSEFETDFRGRVFFNAEILRVDKIVVTLVSSQYRIPHIENIETHYGVTTLKADFETFSITYSNQREGSFGPGLYLRPFYGHYPDKYLPFERSSENPFGYEVVSLEIGTDEADSDSPRSMVTAMSDADEDITNYHLVLRDPALLNINRIAAPVASPRGRPVSPLIPAPRGRPLLRHGRPVSPVSPHRLAMTENKNRTISPPRGGAGAVRVSSPRGGAGAASPASSRSPSSSPDDERPGVAPKRPGMVPIRPSISRPGAKIGRQ
jgi:hypothetical protein